MVRIIYFGKLADVSGCFEEILSLPDQIQNTRDLKLWLDDRISAAGAVTDPSVRIALDGEIATANSPLSNVQEIAIMPTVGGG